VLLNRFIAAGHSAVKELNSNYSDFWTDPAIAVLTKKDE